VLSKKDEKERLESYREKFYAGARAKGVVDETVGDVWAMIEDFARRAAPGRDEAEALVGAGALDSLEAGDSRAEKLMRLLSVLAAKDDRESSGPELFAPEPAASPSPRNVRPDTERRRLEAEMHYLGTTLAVHPLALWPGALARPRARRKDLPALVGHRVELLGWPITAKTVVTSEEEPMEFVSFEDETALYETVLFPDAYRAFRHLLFEERPLSIWGTVENDRGAITVTVSRIVRAQ